MPFTQSHAMSIVSTALLGTSVAAGLVFGLVACTSDREPSEPQVSESSSTSAEPSANEPPSSNSTTETAEPPKNLTPPVKPEAMKHNTEEGAIAFANYFLDVYEYTFLSGDTLELRAISTATCSVCEQASKVATDLHDRKIQVVGYRVSDRENLEVKVIVEDTTFGISGRLTQKGFKYLSETNEVLNSTGDSKLESALVVSKETGRWQVLKFGTEDK